MWYKSPLLHFVVLGAAAFLLHGLLRGSGVSDSKRIEVTPGQVERLRAQFEAQWRRSPTEEELEGLVDAWVREEILYREALALGLDEEDTVVRRRLAQKMELFADDLATRAEPTPEELSRYYEAHREDYTLPARVSFSQIYFSADRRGDRAEADARKALKDPDSEEGDPFMLPRGFPSRTEREVRDLFGDGFARALFALEPGAWHGPIRSSYGFHLVFVRARAEARVLPLPDVVDRVRSDLIEERRRKARDAFIESLKARYEILVDFP